jgi:hypothetical protein
MRILYIIIIICLAGFISGHAQSDKKTSSSNTGNTSEATPDKGKSGKVKQTYKSNRYHHSKNQHDKVNDNDVVTDQSLKNARHAKKHNEASEKFKKKQAKYLNDLNSKSSYKDLKRNTGIFYIY